MGMTGRRPDRVSIARFPTQKLTAMRYLAPRPERRCLSSWGALRGKLLPPPT